VEGHFQGITKPEGQDNQSLPLPHASHGPPPHSGEDLHPLHTSPVAPAQAGATAFFAKRVSLGDDAIVTVIPYFCGA
jgi:hypothetical protein